MLVPVFGLAVYDSVFSAFSSILGVLGDAYPDVPRTMVQMVLSVPPLVSIPGTLFSGFLSSYVRKKRIAEFALAVLFVGGMIPAVLPEPSIYALFACSACVGLGQGLLHPMANAFICQTWDDDNVHKLMDLSINKNWIDKEEYPQSAAIDLRCVNMVADLWHAPAPKNGQAVGTNTIGSSEACMLGGMAMKWRWRKRMEAAGKPTNKPNLVCGPVQICWHKFARYWDVELREIPMRPGQLFMDPKRMIEACDENTIGVVPTFGVTYTGNYEFPQPLHDALDKFQADTGIDIDMHIDAASGGFLAPFVAPDIVWDFRLPRVKSISASGHKFGLAPLGCGWVIWRDEEALPQELVFNVDYLGGQIGTFAINFSRPAGQVIAQYYEFLRLGREGYTKVQNASYQVAAYLADEIAKLGPYEFICTGRPDEGIPAVCFKLKDGEDPGYTLYDLSERLRLRGWQVPAFTLGGEATDIVVMRIMCRRGFEMDFAELLLEDYKASLKYLSDHPKLQGIAQQNSFKHT